MITLVTILQFIIGLVFVIYFAEELVDGVSGTARGFGLSAFLISVVFIGFDPENLAVGVSGTYEGVAGIALGAIVGAAMVVIALKFGITALLAPMEFREVPSQILSIQVLAVLLFGGLALDGELLFLGYLLAVGYLLRLHQRGIDIKPKEKTESEEEFEQTNWWKAAGLLVGSELLVQSSKSIITSLNLSDTTFELTILAFLVSIEELARELPAVLRGRAEISFGNVVGSIMAYFLFNGGSSLWSVRLTCRTRSSSSTCR
jgi:cation:H+ antiporter